MKPLDVKDQQTAIKMLATMITLAFFISDGVASSHKELDMFFELAV